MSCSKVTPAHLMLIGYCLAVSDKRNNYLYEVHYRATLAADLNNQSVNVRYNERKHATKLNILDWQNTDFSAVSIAQQAKAIDCFLYNSNCAKGFKNNPIVKKLSLYRDSLEFYDNDYDCSEWFIDTLPQTTPKSHNEFVAEYERTHCVKYRR